MVHLFETREAARAFARDRTAAEDDEAAGTYEATKVVSMQLCRAGPNEVPVDAWAVVDVVDVPAVPAHGGR